jgi:hypothetical protein
MILVLLVGWLFAHVVIRIPNPHWVQDGEYVTLDTFGWLFSLVAVPGMLSAALSLFLLPLAALAQWTANPRRRWRAIVLLAILATPLVCVIAMFRPFGGPPLGIVDWIPD